MKININQLNVLIQYLTKQPYAEVSGLINMLQQIASVSKQIPPKPKTTKPKK